MKVLRVKRVITGLLAGLLLMNSVPPLTASAAPNVDRITISPVDKHYLLKPGEVKRDSFTVINDGSSAYNLAVYARPYSVGSTDEDYSPNFSAQPPNADVYQWVQFDKSEYKLKPSEKVEVKYTVRVPQNATPGGHYGVLFAETQPLEANKNNSIMRRKRLGLIVYATVKGTFKTEGSNQAISIPPLQFKPPLTTSQTVTNTGNSDFTVTGTMNVYDAFGNRKYQLTKDYTLLPDSIRKMPFEWSDASWFGLYKVQLTTKYLKTISTKTSYVLMAPLWIYIVLGIIIIARISYAVSQRKKLKAASEERKEPKKPTKRKDPKETKETK